MPIDRRSVLCLAALAVVAGACVRSGGDAVSPVRSLALGRADRPKLPVFVSNESLTADLYVLGLRAATVDVVTQKSSCGVASGKGKAIIGWQARTTGLVALFRDMHAEMTVSVDVSTGLPIDDHSYWVMDPKPRDYKVHFGRGSYFYDYRRSDGFATAESVPVPEGLWPYDPASGALLIRSLRLAPGDKAHLYAVVGRHLWKVDAVFGGSETLPYREGRRPAVRIEGVTQKITGDPNDRPKRSFKIWFSDDPERVPLLALMDSSLGEVRLELTSYEQRAPDGPCAIAPPARRE
jgi:hypothetical protein